MAAVDNRRAGDPESIPPDQLERLGLRFYIDNNIIGNRSPAVVELQQLHRDGWINLWRTDTIGVELSETKDERKRAALIDEAAGHVESLGPGFWEHSAWDHCVLAGDEDDERHARVYAILFPGSDRADNSTGRARRKFRDAQHVATAIRYGCNGFVTLDDHDLVRKSPEIAARFNGFKIMNPETTLAFVRRMRARYDVRNS